MSDINKYDHKDLTPFKWFVLENFPFIEADFDAITNYQLYSKVVEYLNNTINAVNEIGNTVEEFTQNFINLKNYVDNYFSNLDVQEEINNKLDDLVEDGTLTRLIGDYVQPLIDEQNENIENFKTIINGEITTQNTNINGLANNLNTQKQRIDQITNLPSGSTSGDAELQDIRVGYFGTTYNNAGDAVRGEIAKLSKTGSAICYAKKKIYINKETIEGVKTYTTTVYAGTIVFYNGTSYELLSDQQIVHTETQDRAIMNLIFDLTNKTFDLQRHGLSVPNNYVSVGYADLRVSNFVKNIINNNIVSDDKLCGIIIGYSGNNIVEVNSTNKTITFPNDTILIRNRFITSQNTPSVAAILNNDNRICDYSNINSSAIKIFFDITNNVLVADSYLGTRDKEKFILVATMRTTAKMLSINAPYIFDGLFMGVDINQFVDSSEIFNGKINSNVKSINHRGYMNVAPENTIPAFKLSKSHGFEYVETDVRFTSDGVPVLLHDASINRTARNSDGTQISETINISDITYEDALTYDFGIFKSSSYAGTKIPKYEELLSLARKIGLKCYIELKEGTQAQIESLVDTAKKYGMLENLTWIGNVSYLSIIKNYYSKARLGLVTTDINSNVITACTNLKTNDNEVFADAYFNSNTITNISDQIIESLIQNDIKLEIWDAWESSYINNANPYISGFTTNQLLASYVLYNANKN